MNSCVFAGPADVVTLVEACLDQHLLLAAAGVDQNMGFEVHYQGMAANPENEGGDEFHQQTLRDIAAAELRLQEREREVKTREDRVEAREAELDLLLEAARAELNADGFSDGDSSHSNSGDDSDDDKIVRDVSLLDCSFIQDREEMGQDSSLGDGGEEGGDPKKQARRMVFLFLLTLRPLTPKFIQPCPHLQTPFQDWKSNQLDKPPVHWMR